MVNNKENIINCINSTDDINLIMLHRSLYILKKKFEQNKEALKNIYKKYGEYLEKEEDILIDINYIPILLKDIFNLNKFEISFVDSFKEAMSRELNYCKEINIEEYIFNEFIEFINNNRKRYNLIFREKRNNSIFNLENYDQFELNLIDDLTKEVKVSIVDEDEENENDIINNNKKKISSAKYRNKLFLEDIKTTKKDNLKINLDLIKKNKNTIESNEEDKDNTYSYSESEIGISNRGGKKNNEIESGEGTYRSKLNTKRKIEQNNENNVIIENADEEKESINKNKNDERNGENYDKSENNENSDDNDNNDSNEKNINNNPNNNEKNENKISNDEKEQIENNDNINKNENEYNINDIELNESKKNKTIHLLFSSKKKKTEEQKDKVFYETIYKKDNNIKSINILKHYLYIDIIPLIIADFISDERNLYLILDHSDDFRNNLSTIFDVEILSKIGNNYVDDVLKANIDNIGDAYRLYNEYAAM